MDPVSPSRVIAQIAVVLGLILVTRLRPTTFLTVLSGCIVAMIGYAMIQDAITVHLSFEYFVVAHPRVFETDVRIWHGLIWGFLGGWPGGLCLGIAVACTSTLGPWPPMPARKLILPILVALTWQGLTTFFAALVAWINYERLGLDMVADWAWRIPIEHRRGFVTVAAANMATYTSAVVGAIAVCAWVAWQRRSRRTGL